MSSGTLAACIAAMLASGVAAGCSDNADGDQADASGASSSGAAPCGAGEVEHADGCQPAGVPPDRCGAGFVTDGEGGCTAVMPPAPCGAGMMAVPGDTACREVAPCADGAWGDIEVEANTEYVDAASVDGNGSADSPWATIVEAVDAAAPGAIIALAAGSYAGDVSLQDKPVRLWGRCPAMVEIVGDGTRPAAIFIASGADGTELRGMRIRGPMIGVGLSGSVNVVLDQLWIDSPGGYGIALRQVIGNSSATIARTLVEAASGVGIIADGSTATVDAVEVRDTGADPFGEGGFGLFAQWDPQDSGRPSIDVRGSSFVRNRLAAIGLNGADAIIESSLLADTQLEEATQQFGRGLFVQRDLVTSEPSVVSLVSSVVERCRDVGISVEASEAIIDATVVRDMLPNADDKGGRGINVQSNPYDARQRGRLTLRDSLVHRAMEVAVMATTSDTTMERTLVRATQPRALDALFGDGLAVASGNGISTAHVTASRFEGQPRAGVATFGGVVSIAGTRFECNSIDLDGEQSQGEAFDLQDLGGNACGCAQADRACTVSSSNLAPPEPI
jgi:hypothetical protein